MVEDTATKSVRKVREERSDCNEKKKRGLEAGATLQSYKTVAFLLTATGRQALTRCPNGLEMKSNEPANEKLIGSQIVSSNSVNKMKGTENQCEWMEPGCATRNYCKIT